MADSKSSENPAGKGDEGGPTGLLDGVDAVLALVLIALCGFFYWVSADFPVPGLFLGDNVLPEHEYLNVIGGFLAVTVERVDGTPTLIARHYGVDGEILNEDRQIAVRADNTP